MSDDAALLAAILAHPDEDTPRLMYADWLQENGQPDRAEFIRIQCDPTADEAAEERATALEEQYRTKWLAGLPQFPGARWEFRRGFPEYLDISAYLLLDRYGAFARVPWLRFLSVYDPFPAAVRDFCNRPWPGQWIELHLQEDWGAGDGYTAVPVRALVAGPQVAQLRRLQLSLHELSADDVRELATSPYLDDLQRLHLAGTSDDPRFAPLRERFGDRLVIE